MKKLNLFPRVLFFTVVLFFSTSSTASKDKVEDFLFHLLEQVDPLCQAFFIPEDAPKPLLIELIKQEKRQILAALFNFTEPDVADELLAAYERGVDVQLIADVEGLRGKYERVTTLYDAGVPVFLYAQYRSLMHNKYLVFAESVGGRSVLWSGSANITKAGLHSNEENVQVTVDAALINEYRGAFENTKQRIRDAKKDKSSIRPYCKYVGNKLLVKLGKNERRFKCF